MVPRASGWRGTHTYVAERNLEADESGEAIHHPLLSVLCGEFRDGHYTTGDTIQ